VAGAGAGPALRLDEPLSFWGGVDPSSGAIIDGRHPQAGSSVAGRVLVVPSGRGSSSSSSVLAEAVRAGTAPAAIVLCEPDPILVVGAMVAAGLYGTSVPVVVLAGDDYRELAAEAEDRWLEVRADPNEATVRVIPPEPPAAPPPPGRT